MRFVAVAVSALVLLGGCAKETELESPETVDSLAETYVRLVLGVGEHDADFVDAYIGPPEWRTEASARAASLDELTAETAAAGAALTALPRTGLDETDRLRYRHLETSYDALAARLDMLRGERLTFDQESAALYDAVAPSHDAAHFQTILDRLDRALPGDGPLIERYDAYRSAFVVPAEHLDAVLTAAIAACRERTGEHMVLPESESFTVEYVTDKSWSGYNWYQGEYRSLIQINTDLPIYVDRMLDLACHEGYPGHHVYNLVIERDLVNGHGWKEFMVYPLFSPRSLIAEGTANYGIEVAFPGAERLAFERDVLFPLSGLDPGRAAGYYEIQELLEGLSFAGNEAARRYLDGEIDAQAAADWLETYSLMSRPRAEQRVRFIDQYRSYVINYNLGLELVREYVEARGGTAESPGRRWELFAELLASPILPSQLTP